jgi:hypothetical protein
LIGRVGGEAELVEQLGKADGWDLETFGESDSFAVDRVDDTGNSTPPPVASIQPALSTMPGG